MTKTHSVDKTGKDGASAALLPLAPRTLCFDKNEFMKTDFSVDNFVADCRKRVRLETLRQDLEIYFKLLKNAMIELINKDYADFVNLSTNLVGLDKTIGQLRDPLRKIKEDVTDVEVAIHTKLLEIESAFEKQRKLAEKRQLLGHMRGLLQAVEKIEHIQQSEEAKTGQTLERIAGEFNQLQHHAGYCKGLRVLTQIRQRVAEITAKLQNSLERELVHGLENKETKQVNRCLNSYALISKTHDAEHLVRIHVVEPFMAQVLDEQNGNVSVTPLKMMFSRILELVPNHLKVLCDVTSGRKNTRGEQYRGIPGYDFVVNSAWPQIVLSIEKKLPELFASRNPNAFHKRYLLCMEFVSNFERQCGSQASIARLRQSNSYFALMTHWSLPVYFQIRFQEIGGKFEVSLANATQMNTDAQSEYRLLSSYTLWECIKTCWSDDVFLAALIHRFWKLTLQLLSRYGTWIKELHDLQVVSENSSRNADFTPLPLNQLASLIVDMNKIFVESKKLFNDRIEPQASKHGLKDTNVLKNALEEVLSTLTVCKEGFVKHIISSLSSSSTPFLKQAQDVPRLFRKTNRPAPTEASAYVNGATKPACTFYTDQVSYVDEEIVSTWLTEVASTISERYYAVVSDVLTSVRKMEESLMRLQKLRSGKYSSGNLASLAAGSDALSDDDKIRLQLYLDVVSFGNQMSSCGVQLESVKKYQDLLKMVEEAKNKSSISS